jgi:hypothetical protein
MCSRVTIDRSDPPLVLIFLNDGPAARVEVNAPFRLLIGAEAWLLDPWEDRRSLAPVLSLIGRTVTEAAAVKSGGLRLEFSGGAALEVEPSEAMTEPWSFDIEDQMEDPRT